MSPDSANVQPVAAVGIDSNYQRKIMPTKSEWERRIDSNPNVDQELLDAKLHAEAVEIIATALQDCSHPTLTRRDHEGNATAILARLAHANILIERYRD